MLRLVLLGFLCVAASGCAHSKPATPPASAMRYEVLIQQPEELSGQRLLWVVEPTSRAALEGVELRWPGGGPLRSDEHGLLRLPVEPEVARANPTLEWVVPEGAQGAEVVPVCAIAPPEAGPQPDPLASCKLACDQFVLSAGCPERPASVTFGLPFMGSAQLRERMAPPLATGLREAYGEEVEQRLEQVHLAGETLSAARLLVGPPEARKLEGLVVGMGDAQGRPRVLVCFWPPSSGPSGCDDVLTALARRTAKWPEAIRLPAREAPAE